ncbi:nucleoside phosphorylase [Patescibacteria group bacterium]|nr:nucleoside phosphorylase [Patescibacteria group bacterium]
MTKQPHINVSAKDISPYVLLPGDPGRVYTIGKKLKNFKILSKKREYTVGIGTYKDTPVTICSTGIGCPSTAIATEELIDSGAKYLIRIGTCGGGWRSDVKPGSIIIPTASIRDEGTTKEYIPKEFPAVANFEVVQTLVRSAKQCGVPYSIGINRTHDAFYGNQEDITKWGAYLKEDRWKNYDTPILSSEMESAALFVIAALKGVKAGALFAVNAEPEPLKNRIFGTDQAVITESSKDITKQTVSAIIDVALEALVELDKS